MRPVVLFELDQPDWICRGPEIALEVLHVGDVGAAERINGLVVVADGEHSCIGPREQPQPAVLEHVRVLELVDEQM